MNISGIRKLKKLMEAAENLSSEDIARFRARADRIEQLLERQVELLEQILREVKRLGKAK